MSDVPRQDPDPVVRSETSETVATGYPVNERRNGAGVAALVVGVVALVLAVLIIFFPIAGILGLIAVILGIVGVNRASRGEADNRGQAAAGLITGLLALTIAIALTIRIGSFMSDHQADFRRLGSCLSSADDTAQRSDCLATFSDAMDEND